MQWGAGASPIIVDGMVIVQCDCQGEDFLVAYKVENGEEIWKTERDEYPSWSTPLVYRHGNGAQIVCNGFKHAGGYDLQTGAEIWKITAGLGDEPITSPIPMGDLIFVTSTHGRFAPLLAIRPTAKGDITLPRGETTNEHIVWSALGIKPSPQPDLAAIGSELDSIVNQVVKHPLDKPEVHMQRRQIWCRRDLECDLSLHRQRREPGGDRLQKRCHIHRLRIGRHLAAFQAADIQQIINQTQHMVVALLHQCQRFLERFCAAFGQLHFHERQAARHHCER